MSKKIFNPFSKKWIDDPREKQQQIPLSVSANSIKQEDTVTAVPTVFSVDITIGDETVQNLLREQNNPLELQEKLKALFSADIKTDDPFPINARELQEFLNLSYDHSTWIKRMIDYGFIEGKDYEILLHKNEEQNKHGGSNRRDYLLSVDMTKEVAMIQRNSLGRLVRAYLIWAEKNLREITAMISQQQVQVPATPAMAILEIGKAMVAMEQNQNRQNTIVQNQIADLISTDSHLQEQIDQNNEAIKEFREQLSSRGNSNNSNTSILTEERNYNPITAEGNTTTREFSEMLQGLGYDMGIVKLNNYLVDNGMFQRLKKKGYKAKKRFLDLGWFVNRTEDVELPNGDIVEQYKVDITPIGRQSLLIRIENHNN